MFSFHKIVPALFLGMLVHAQDEVAAAKNKEPTPQQMKSMCIEPMRGIMEGPKSCCYARSAPNAYGAAMEFEFLWWSAQNNGFIVAYNQKNSDFVTPAEPGDSGSVLRLHPEWDPGFRFGIGYNSVYDRWDLFANWTWYANHTTRDDAATGSFPQGFYTVNPDYSPADADPFDYGLLHGSWQLWHNSVDLELGRAFYITQKLSLRPHWGVRGAWLRQKFLSRFTDPRHDTSSYRDEYHYKNDFWGVGPRLGLNTDYHIGMGFSVIGRGAASLLYGQSKAEIFEKTQFAEDSATELAVKMEDYLTQLAPAFQLYLGLGWEACVQSDRVFFGIDAGWETNYYGNQYQVPTVLLDRPAPLPTIGNQPVTMQGLTVNAHVDF